MSIFGKSKRIRIAAYKAAYHKMTPEERKVRGNILKEIVLTGFWRNRAVVEQLMAAAEVEMEEFYAKLN